MKLESLLQSKKAIEQRLIENKDHISFELFASWRHLQQEIGKHLVTLAMHEVAKKYDVYILANPVNTASYAHFLRNDVQSKSCTLRQRTARDGIQNGFITEHVPELKTIPLSFTMQGEKFFAVLRNDTPMLTSTPLESDKKIQACCYLDEKYVVSDIDLLFIVMKTSSDMLCDVQFGELTCAEKEVIIELNQTFQNIRGEIGTSEFKLVAHGPSNRFSESKVSHIHFPIEVYGKDACAPIETIEQLLLFLTKLEKQGFEIALNPKWNL
jgi:hypothetical protein